MVEVKIKPKFDEEKTTQAAAYILKLNNGRMDYMKLVKLLYNIDREAINEWVRPVTFDDFYSLPKGLVVSNTLDKAEKPASISKTYWNRFIQTRGYENSLLPGTECGIDRLSPAEIRLIEKVYNAYKDKDQYEMESEHHNPDLFPEYTNPNGSCIYTTYEKVLAVLGFS